MKIKPPNIPIKPINLKHIAEGVSEAVVDKTAVAAGLWKKCDGCGKLIFHSELKDNFETCPHCDTHFRISAKNRIKLIVDKDSFEQDEKHLIAGDPLEFEDLKKYPDRLKENQKNTRLDEAVVWGIADIDGIRSVVAAMEFRFMGGSMGSVVGETITRCVNKAIELSVPLVIICSSGGARMQEGLFSLMQMAKTSAAVGKLSKEKIPYISILCNPTSGGVAASFATLADVMIAEKGAFVGFAGPRVIEQTISQKLPEGFQTAEFCMERGMVDIVVHRRDLRDKVRNILNYLYIQGRAGRNSSKEHPPDVRPIGAPYNSYNMETGRESEGQDRNIDPWEVVKLARHNARPRFLFYAEEVFDGFLELHGDRLYGDDKAIIGGLATLYGIPVMLIGHNRGSSFDRTAAWKCNNGMPHPEGIRKAARLMKLAEKFNLPIITMVDTPGAYPGVGAEERGQANAIAEIIRDMFQLEVPIISVIIGEGGSGGALSIAVSDRLLVMENATFSVITPEGCAAILWRDSTKAPLAASALKLTSRDLLESGIADEIIPEPDGGAHNDPQETATIMSRHIYKHLNYFIENGIENLVDDRYNKYTSIGVFEEAET